MTHPWKDIFEVDSNEEAARLLYKLYKVYSASHLAECFKTSEVTVRNFLKGNGYTLKHRGGCNTLKKATISQEEYDSMTYKMIAKVKGISVSEVYLLTRELKPKAKGCSSARATPERPGT